MQSATERRQLILEYISDMRKVTIQNIVDEFDISRATAKRDIELLSCSYPIVTENWRGGGIRAMDGWYLSNRYLHDDQEALLRELLTGLQPEQQKTIGWHTDHCKEKSRTRLPTQKDKRRWPQQPSHIARRISAQKRHQ